MSEYFKYFRFLLKFTSKGKGQIFLVKRSEISNNEVIEMNSIVSFAQMDKTVCYSRSWPRVPKSYYNKFACGWTSPVLFLKCHTLRNSKYSLPIQIGSALRKTIFWISGSNILYLLNNFSTKKFFSTKNFFQLHRHAILSNTVRTFWILSLFAGILIFLF